MRWFTFVAMLVLPLVSVQRADAVETCECSARFTQRITGEWSDYLCMFPSWSGGPYENLLTARWTYTFGTPLVFWRRGYLWNEQEMLMFEVGKNRENCETSGTQFQEVALSILKRKCAEESGKDCNEMKITCVYRSR